MGTLVLMANEQARRALHATIDAERERNERLSSENQRLQCERLQCELDQVKPELTLERQNKLATIPQKQESGKTTETTRAAMTPAASGTKKKRGASVRLGPLRREIRPLSIWHITQRPESMTGRMAHCAPLQAQPSASVRLMFSNQPPARREAELEQFRVRNPRRSITWNDDGSSFDITDQMDDRVRRDLDSSVVLSLPPVIRAHITSARRSHARPC